MTSVEGGSVAANAGESRRLRTTLGLRARTVSFCVSFVALVSASVWASLAITANQGRDAALVNLAGRQRMLVQQMMHEVLEIRVRQIPYAAATKLLSSAAETYGETLRSLSEGGEIDGAGGERVRVTRAADPDVREGLARVDMLWKAMAVHVAALARSERAGPETERSLAAIEAGLPGLQGATNHLVTLYEDAAVRRVHWLRRIQIAFLVLSVALMGLALWSMETSVVRPIRGLMGAAARIGSEDLSSEVQASGAGEVRNLGTAIESMRRELAGSRSRISRYAAQLAALHETTAEISTHLDPRRVLQSVAERARDLLEAEAAAVCCLKEGGGALELAAGAGLRGQSDAGDEGGPPCRIRPLPKGIHDMANGSGCPILGSDLSGSHVIAPLKTDRVLGVLCVASREEGRFGRDERELVTLLADSAAIALENARLYEESKDLAALRERRRIAADMHDSLGQALNLVRMELDSIGGLARAGRCDDVGAVLARLRGLMDQALEDVRTAIADLQGGAAPPRPLEAELARLLEQYGDEDRERIRIECGGEAQTFLSREETEQVTRIVREALQNALRHASAGSIRVRLGSPTGRHEVVIEDDGRGFEPGGVVEAEGHFGLSIMRARATRIGGELSIESTAGLGTRLRLTWPAGRTEETA